MHPSPGLSSLLNVYINFQNIRHQPSSSFSLAASRSLAFASSRSFYCSKSYFLNYSVDKPVVFNYSIYSCRFVFAFGFFIHVFHHLHLFPTHLDYTSIHGYSCTFSNISGFEVCIHCSNRLKICMLLDERTHFELFLVQICLLQH